MAYWSPSMLVDILAHYIQSEWKMQLKGLRPPGIGSRRLQRGSRRFRSGGRFGRQGRTAGPGRLLSPSSRRGA